MIVFRKYIYPMILASLLFFSNVGLVESEDGRFKYPKIVREGKSLKF